MVEHLPSMPAALRFIPLPGEGKLHRGKNKLTAGLSRFPTQYHRVQSTSGSVNTVPGEPYLTLQLFTYILSVPFTIKRSGWWCFPEFCELLKQINN